MRDYAKGRPGFWTGDLAAKIYGNAHAHALGWILITGPHSNMLGLYRLPFSYMLEDLGYKEADLRAAIGALETAGFCLYDESNRLVWVIEGARHEWGNDPHPADKKTIHLKTHAPKLLEQAGKSGLVWGFLERYSRGAWAEVYEALDKGFARACQALAEGGGSPYEGGSEALAKKEQYSTVEGEVEEAEEDSAEPPQTAGSAPTNESEENDGRQEAREDQRQKGHADAEGTEGDHVRHRGDEVGDEDRQPPKELRAPEEAESNGAGVASAKPKLADFSLDWPAIWTHYRRSCPKRTSAKTQTEMRLLRWYTEGRAQTKLNGVTWPKSDPMNWTQEEILDAIDLYRAKTDPDYTARPDVFISQHLEQLVEQVRDGYQAPDPAMSREDLYRAKREAPAAEGWEEEEIDLNDRLERLAALMPEASDEILALCGENGAAQDASSIEHRLAEIDLDILTQRKSSLDADTRRAIKDKFQSARGELAKRVAAAELKEAEGKLGQRVLREHLGLPVLSLFSPEASGS